jgi:DNA-binding NarL/FixJ family response regulator
MPEMLRTIIGDLLGRERDLLVVGDSAKGDDALRRARADRADVLITHDRESEGNLCLDQVLSASPISILAISDDGRTADAVCLARQPVALNGGSQSRLAEAVREIAEHRNAPGVGWGRQRPA